MVLAEKKEFAKTFDEKEDDFVILRNEKDLESLEAYRFIESQIHLLGNKIEKLSSILEKGGFEGDTEEGQRRVEELERRFGVIQTKFNLYVEILGEVNKSLSTLSQPVDGLATIVNTKGLAERVSKLEGIELESRKYNVKDVFIEMVQALGLIGKRINNLESMVEKLNK